MNITGMTTMIADVLQLKQHGVHKYLYTRCDMVYQLRGVGIDAWLVLLICLLHTLSSNHTVRENRHQRCKQQAISGHMQPGYVFMQPAA